MAEVKTERRFSYSKFESLCEQNKETPYKVAIGSGIATATLTNWKQGKYTPKLDKISKIATHFGVSIESLIEEVELEG